MQYEIRAMGLGEILDQGIQLTKNHFALFFKVTLYALIPVSLAFGMYLEYLVQDETRILENLGAIQVAGGLNALVTLLFVLPVTYIGLAYVIAEVYLGRSITAGDAFHRGLSCIVPVIIASILYYLIVMIGIVLLIIPGIIFGIWFGLYYLVIAIENKTGIEALKRSKALVSTAFLTLFVLGFVVGIISFCIQLISGFVPVPYVGTIIGSVGGAIVIIFAVSCSVVYYFSCRCRLENFDLELLAESMGVTLEDDGDSDDDDLDNPFA